MASNYDIIPNEIDRFFQEGDLKLQADDGVPVIIKADGTIVAQGFKDVQDPIQLFIRDGDIHAKIDGPATSIIEYKFKDNTVIYKVPVQSKLETQDRFDNFQGRIGESNKVARDKFQKGFNKEEKTAIYTFCVARNSEFHFLNNVSGTNYSEPTCKTLKYFKPVNIPTKLVLDSDFKSCRDFIVVKTGEVRYAPDGVTPSGLNREGIVWVSPHEKFSFTGVSTRATFVSGAKTSASKSYGSGQSGNLNLPLLTGISRISSQRIHISSGHTLTGGMVCKRFSQNDSGSLVDFTGHSNLEDSLFFQTVTGKHTGVAWEKMKSGFYTGAAWNGIIPSGIPVKIETYSSSDYYGADCVISQVPTGTDVTFNATVIASATGQGGTYDEAIQAGFADLEKTIRNKIDFAFQSSGWRRENAKLAKFKKLINRASSQGEIELTGLQSPS